MPNSASAQSRVQNILSIISLFSWVDILSYSLLPLFFFFGFQLTYSKNLFRAVVPQLPTLNKHLGQVGKVNGVVDKRAQWDVIWFPVQTEDPVFEGDRVMTGNESGVELVFGAELKLDLGPNSLVQIRTRGGQFFLDLIAGEMKIKSKKDQKVIVRKNSEVTEVSKAEARVEADLSGDFLKEDKEDPPPLPEEKDEGEDKAPETPVLPPPPMDPKAYPPDGAVLLIQASSKVIKIYGAKVCPDSCSLQVKVNGANFKNLSFRQGDEVFFNYEWSAGQRHELDWKYSNQAQSLHRRFSVESFSLEAMKKALKQSKNVEVQ